MAPHCSDLVFILSSVDYEGKTNSGLGQRAILGMPDEAVMTERIDFSSSRSGVECLFVEQGGKKMGGGDPLKISSTSCFVKMLCEWREQEKAERRQQSGQCLGLDGVVEERE